MNGDITVWPGQPYPLGATWDGAGVNFALFSEHAERVELCLFDGGPRFEHRITMPERTDHVWHGYLPEARPGQLYGYRVHGPYAPAQGHRFNPQQAAARSVREGDRRRRSSGATRMFGYRIGEPTRRTCRSTSATTRGGMPRAAVVDPAFSWGGDAPPTHAVARHGDLRVHVKGFTQQHPDVPQTLRGTYAGSRAAPAIEHLQRLGVTAVELLPVHHVRRRPASWSTSGLRNYWGYNTIGFFAPDTALLVAERRGRGARVQDDGASAARGRHRGDPRRGLQPHRRRQSARADAVVPRHRQRRLLPARRRRPALLHGLHRLRQHAEHAASARAAADHGQPALLGARRCTSTASASISRRRWRASCTTSTGSARSSTSSIRTRCSRR